MLSSRIINYGWIAGVMTMLSAAAAPASNAAIDMEPAMPAVQTGQRLVYAIKWGFFSAGTAVLEIKDGQRAGQEVYELELRARTSGLFGKVYPLNVWIKSVLSKDLRRSLGFRKVQNQTDTRIVFNWQAQTAQYIRDNTKHPPIELPGGALDPLSLLMVARTQRLEVGSSLATMFTDGKRCVAGEARVERTERVRTGAGRFQTVVVVPVLQNVGGVFAKSKDSSLAIWISQDGRRLPVRIASKITLGHLVGELIEVQAL